jgi:hypothetical protein
MPMSRAIGATAGCRGDSVWPVPDGSDTEAVNKNAASTNNNDSTKTIMSNISAVSSSTNPYSNPFSQNQSFKDLQSIGSALQSGDLSTAQSALASFQQQLQSSSQASSSQPFGNNSQANQDYQSLATALKSGDTSAAQQAFANLKTDLKSAQKGHHHHHGAPASTATTASTTTPGTSTSSTAISANTTTNINATA